LTKNKKQNNKNKNKQTTERDILFILSSKGGNKTWRQLIWWHKLTLLFFLHKGNMPEDTGILKRNYQSFTKGVFKSHKSHDRQTTTQWPNDKRQTMVGKTLYTET